MAMKCDEVGSECYSYLRFISFRVSVESEKGEMNRGAVEKRREGVLFIYYCCSLYAYLGTYGFG
jgi:hypothetical protein